jgi:hypothetical protein
VPHLAVLVLDDSNLVDDVISAWLTLGVAGVTILDSAGLGHLIGGRALSDDVPLFPSLNALLRQREETHRTLFAVVPDDFDVDALAAATESVTRPLNEPDTGILFIMPVTKAWGLHRRRS